jgi:hypothetical protein
MFAFKRSNALATEIHLPIWHPGQVRVWNDRGRFNVVRCGRRWGKSKMLITLAADTAMKGKVSGIFTPEAKQWREPYDELKERLEAITRQSDANKGRIRLTTRGPDKTGGKIDCWHTDDNSLAGRGPSYHRILGDETAFAKTGQMVSVWNKNLRPTLLTTRGEAWFFSTPYGDDPDNFFWQICNDPALGFTHHHAPSSDSPYCPPDELELIRLGTHPLVFKQEYLAEFVSWKDAAFFKLDYFLGADGLPVGMPTKCDLVFAVMDCAVKSGTDNDGTGVLYCAYTAVGREHKLVWLDYELHSINAANLEYLAPKVLARCEELARECGARQGSAGVQVEDAAGGAVLLQKATAEGWPMYAIPSDLMAKGKDERAMIAGGPAYKGDCKISEPCFNKVIEWKGRSANHLVHQLTSFRIADKDAYKRADDLLDCATYSIALSLADARALG